jgi:hypothetical protein
MFLRVYVKKNGRTYDVGEFEELPASSREAIVNYGAKQLANDSHASVIWENREGKRVFTGTEAEYHAEVDREVSEWIVKVKAGQLRTQVTEDPAVVARRFFESQGYTPAEIDRMIANAPAAKKTAKKAA